MAVKQAPASEFSEQFVQGMRDRMAVSYYKYGPLVDAYPAKVNALESLRLRLDKYYETGNTEFLVDAANFAMIEFMRPSHPQAHFRPTESNESPGRCAYDTNFEPTQSENSQLTDAEWRELKAARK